MWLNGLSCVTFISCFGGFIRALIVSHMGSIRRISKGLVQNPHHKP